MHILYILCTQHIHVNNTRQARPSRAKLSRAAPSQAMLHTGTNKTPWNHWRSFCSWVRLGSEWLCSKLSRGGRAKPGQAEPSRAKPSQTKAKPRRAKPSRAKPHTGEKKHRGASGGVFFSWVRLGSGWLCSKVSRGGRAKPSQAGPSQAEPSRAEPSQAKPSPTEAEPHRRKKNSGSNKNAPRRQAPQMPQRPETHKTKTKTNTKAQKSRKPKIQKLKALNPLQPCTNSPPPIVQHAP